MIRGLDRKVIIALVLLCLALVACDSPNGQPTTGGTPVAGPPDTVVPVTTQPPPSRPPPTTSAPLSPTTPPPPPPPPTTPPPHCLQGAISWDVADDHIGEYSIVCGPVVGSHYASSSNGQPTFLNLGRDFPDIDRFTVVIWGDDRERFPPEPEQFYLGKIICVTGRIEVYAGTAEIIAADPSVLVEC